MIHRGKILRGVRAVPFLMAACVVFLLPDTAQSADRSGACDLGDAAGARLAGKAACLLVGAASEYALHEAGHALVGIGDVGWAGLTWRCPGCSRGRAQTIAVSGFALPALVAEELIDVPKAPRDHPLVAGFLLAAVLHPLIYAVENEAGGGGRGDFGNFSRGNQRILEGAIVGVAAIQAVRLLWWDEKFPLALKATRQDVVTVLTWRW